MFVNVLLLSVSLLQASSGHVAPPATDFARTTSLEVTADGAFQRELTRADLGQLGGSQELTTGGTLWSHTDGGAAWIGTSVELGNHGTQVFTEYSLNNENTELFSAFDVNPPTAIWSDGSSVGTESNMVASAAKADVHFEGNQLYLGGSGSTRQSTVRKFTSSSSTADWSYTFPTITAGSLKIAASSDGGTLVAAMMNTNTMSVEIAVFGPNSGTPLSYTVMPPQTSLSLRGFDLSADGSTLYYSQGASAYVVDLANQALAFTTNIGASFDSHAISGDGSVIAFGSFNVLRVFKRSAGTYTNTLSKNLSGSTYCARMDLSADGSTLAYGWYFYSPGTTARVEALDVATGNITMTHDLVGVSGLQNTLGDISVCDDGSRFAVGVWGDGAGPVAELSLYSSTQNAPLLALNLGGSVFDVDISADGQRIVGGSKAVHANTFGSGGAVTLLDAGGQDFTMRGAPRIGTTPSLEIFGPANKPAVMLSAALPQSPPAMFPGIGTLYVNRPTLVFTGLGSTDGNGQLTAGYPIANNPALIGTDQYLQVLFLSPRVLSNDWLKVTALP